MYTLVIRGLVGIARTPFLALIAAGALLAWAASLADDQLKRRTGRLASVLNLSLKATAALLVVSICAGVVGIFLRLVIVGMLWKMFHA